MKNKKKNNIQTFKMDGMIHKTNSLTGCCDAFGEKCKCGGFMHYQPIYGGCYYKCEDCHRKET